MSLIGANSEAAARTSLRQLQGGVSGFVREVSEELKEWMALIEACTDFPDEVEEEEAAQRVRRGILSVSDKIASKIDERGAKLSKAFEPLTDEEKEQLHSVCQNIKDLMKETLNIE